MMFFKHSLFCFLFLFSSSSSSDAYSTQKQSYVIHTDRSKTKQIYQSLLESTQQSTEDVPETSQPEIHYIYETAISGFSAKLTAKQLELVKNTDGFLSVYPDELLSLHTTHSPRFLGLDLGIGLWNATSLASDVIIGVVDTGIWPEHVSFRDKHMSPAPARWRGKCESGANFSSSSCNKKVIGARAFYKGYESIIGKINETTDFRSPRDAQGHGSHTASTAAGNMVPNANLFGLAKGDFAAGMRFTSRIAAYKACWQYGCASSDVLAAIDGAVSDGVDVISLSLGGSSRPFYLDPVAIASFGAMENRVFVSCSAGNSGPDKSTVSNGPPWVMTVAASYTDRAFPAIVELGTGEKFVGSSLYKGKSVKKRFLAYKETAGGAGAEFCVKNSLIRELVKGKIVICLRGRGGRTDKGQEVKRNGGAAMLLVNTAKEGKELLADAHVLPATSLEASAGNAIAKYLNASRNAATASISFKGTVYGHTAPVIAHFSSRGPSVAGPEILKPDISAPGVNILAAWSPFSSPSLLRSDTRHVRFNIISGTSMSCPHISGLAALILAVHRDWSPAMVKSALMTTANTTNNRNRPIGDISADDSSPATAFAIGAGHVNPTCAADPGLVYDISTLDYLNYLCSLNYTAERRFLFAGKNYSCPNHVVLNPGDLNYPSFAVDFRGGDGRKVTASYKRTVTNVGPPNCEYVAQVEEPKGVKVKVKPKVLRFQKVRERLSYRVTFVPEVSRRSSSSFSFGALIWVCKSYRVRSPIAVTWE